VEAETRALYARVQGIVQGVGFRYAAINKARALRLRGYVRNMSDGSVEVLAEGTSEALSSLLAWLKRGPSGARVTAVDHRYVEAHGTPPSRYDLCRWVLSA
jgi:acylphosphatase